jgi:phosphoenolpyruvate synthase/pyruvate phosphate dikinase
MKLEKISKKIENQILKKDWEFSYERRMGFHMMYLFAFGITDEFKKIFGVGMEGSVFRVVDGVTGQYYSKSGIVQVQKTIETKLKKNKHFAKKIQKLIQLKFKAYVSYSKGLTHKYNLVSNQSLWKSIQKHKKIEESISAPSWIMFTSFEEVLTRVLEEKLGKEVVAQLAPQTHITPLEMYLSDVYKKDLDFVTKKYQFLGMFDFFFEPKGRDFHLANLRKMKAEKFNSVEVKQKYTKAKKQVSKIAKQYKQEKDLIDLFLTYSDLKEWKNFWREELAFKYSFLMKEVSIRCNVGLEELSFYTYTELEQLIKRNLKLSVTEIDMRKASSLFVFYKNKVYVVTDTGFLKKFNVAFQHKQEDDFLKGSVAFAGKIKGIVKVIIGNQDFHKIKEGDILVTSTTRPDYLPVMQKSAGFITNEGGLLSHATIVARELKKPCIIGTKIATKVLKDGDLVEVDAEKGIVRIIKKA